MKPVAFAWARPASLTEAAAALAAPETRPIAGGMSLGPMLNLRLARPAGLVELTRLAELAEVRDSGDRIRLGATLTHAAIEDGAVPEPIPGMLRTIAAGIAHRAVRNRGTLGGSLAHADPAADWLTAMTALDATVETLRLSAAGPAPGRAIPIRRFVRGAYATALEDGEIVAAVSLPRATRAARWGWCKIARKHGAFASAIGAAVVDPGRGTARLVAGATGGAPLVLPDLAERLARTAAPLPAADIAAALAAGLEAAGLPAPAVKLQQLATAVRRAVDQLLADEGAA